ncbi:peptidase M13 [Kribbella sandramycini]|uniref:Peptidase M13 n=1 Tax=Kribbella sandramycini TaxID=60450 RepID=A0A7Y4L700_9ACTN|nr:M13-type metalloendopeptidase [Kribbella sandramycini]MBB6566753.1 putative endopeptidase [Kribbella sandramycini]NOL45539.1 peptidase M13 [Kribbella sandramycini]
MTADSNGSGPVRPQDDLYQFVNGAWLAEHDIPADKAIYGAFHVLRDTAEQDVRAIVEKAVAAGHPEGSDARKIADLYTSFLDAETVERLGAEPIADQLALADAVSDVPGLVAALGQLELEGVTGVFRVWVDGDAKKSDEYIVYLMQGGLSLPDESYYREEERADVRAAYVAHVAKLLELAGRPDPAGAAERILALETRLAANHWDRVRERDVTQTYNKLDRAALEALTPGLGWSRWLAASTVPESAFAQVVVREPSFFTAAAAALQEIPLAEWKEWLSWRIVHSAAPYLSSAFVEENFAFYGKTLTGAPELRDRWKRGIDVVEGSLGEALGQLYVAEHFPPAAKSRMVELVANLVEAYRQRIEGLDWMGPETRQRALDKLGTFVPKIGYPDKWKDYSALEVDPADLIGNLRRSVAVETARELAKLGTPVDRDEWHMPPQTVNAYYNPRQNEIVFPAGILHPPFFDLDADDAVNYGAIGAVIGHEIGHGFDDQGSRYDGAGNLNDWWTDEDRAAFEARTDKLVAQYDALSPAETPGQHVNGKLTLGENIGDLGGLAIAYVAYQLSLAGAEAPTIDNTTGPERFFAAWAFAWATKTRPEEAARRLTIDPHSPPEFRCNAVVKNIDAFHDTYQTTEGDAMYLPPEDRVRIW